MAHDNSPLEPPGPTIVRRARGGRVLRQILRRLHHETDVTDRAPCRIALHFCGGTRYGRAVLCRVRRRGACLPRPLYDLAERRRNVSRAGAESVECGFPRDDCARERDRPGPGLVGRHRLPSHADPPLPATRRQHRHGVAQLVRATQDRARPHSSPTKAASPTPSSASARSSPRTRRLGTSFSISPRCLATISICATSLTTGSRPPKRIDSIQRSPISMPSRRFPRTT